VATYDELMQQWLDQQGQPWSPQDAYGPTVQPYQVAGGGIIAPPMNKYGDVEPLDLDAQSKSYTTLKNWANLNSDPAILGGLYGQQPGYTTSYTPLPQLTALTNQARNPNTIEGMIATEILGGFGAASAISKIRKMIDPNSEFYDPEIAAMAPTYTQVDEATGDETELLDENYLKDIATEFQQQYLSAPMDPATGQPNYVIDPTTGMPSMPTTELDEIGQWYERTGTPFPQEQYSPDILASPEALMRQQMAPNQYMGARRSVVDADRASRAFREQMQRAVLQPQAQTPTTPSVGKAPVPGREQIPQAPGVSDDLMRFFQHPGQSIQGAIQSGVNENIASARNAGDVAVGGLGAVARGAMASGIARLGGAAHGVDRLIDVDPGVRSLGSARSPVGGGPPVFSTPVSSGKREKAQVRGMGQMKALLGQATGALQTVANEKKRQQLRDTGLDARKQREDAWHEMNRAQIERRMRQQMIDTLAAQGHTPYNDTMAQRRAMANYGGFGF
jgi:hypothetical protein